VLTVAKNGPKMKPRKPDDGGEPFSVLPRGSTVPGRNTSMAELAFVLQSIIPFVDRTRVDLPVVDKTGLEGRFDFEITFSPNADSGLPDLFTAVQEQLGLKLEAAKAPLDVMVIDRAEKPSAN
jgi:uncharacterized protein (TIGR03435 family)